MQCRALAGLLVHFDIAIGQQKLDDVFMVFMDGYLQWGLSGVARGLLVDIGLPIIYKNTRSRRLMANKFNYSSKKYFTISSWLQKTA